MCIYMSGWIRELHLFNYVLWYSYLGVCIAPANGMCKDSKYSSQRDAAACSKLWVISALELLLLPVSAIILTYDGVENWNFFRNCNLNKLGILSANQSSHLISPNPPPLHLHLQQNKEREKSSWKRGLLGGGELVKVFYVKLLKGPCFDA